MGIKEQDIVKLMPGAVYYTGRPIPEWVINDTWVVKSVNGDRAVIDKNTSGTGSINSPVNIKFLVLVSESRAEPQSIRQAVQESAEPQPIRQPARESAAPPKQGSMSISSRGVELIAKYEGCRLAAYKCPAGVWTIGYGHTAGVKEGDTLASAEEAMALLAKDLEKYAGYVSACVKKGIITFPLTQNQFDALTSFTYNCGNRSLKKLVSGRDAAAIAEKILQYNKGGGKVLAGLTRRREEERALFLS